MQNSFKNKRIAVLMGGKTKEREISLKTGRAISNALRGLGYNIIDLDVGDGIVDDLRSNAIDIAVVALHGKWGEDGCVQGMLEMMKIPYTGTSLLGSSICMDKEVASFVASSLGVPIPRQIMFQKKKNDIDDFIKKCDLKNKLVVKPSCDGSSINVEIVSTKEQLKSAIEKVLQSDDRAIVQDYVVGKEVTAGIIDDTVLPLLEIAPTNDFYDYEAKYTKGKSRYIVPARISENCSKRIVSHCEKLISFLGLKGTARADFIVSDDDSEYFLEVNTIPGMTELSLVPMAAKHIGIEFAELAEKLLFSANLSG